MEDKKMTESERKARNKLIFEWQLLGMEKMQSRDPKRREEIKKRITELDKILGD